jgi:hypothetical protein
MIHDAAGIARFADHDAAEIVGSMIHDAAEIVGSMIHDAAGIGRSMIHDASGGFQPTPDEPPHGSINLWAFATLRGSMGDDRGVVAIRTRHHPMMPRQWQDPINGPCRASQGWCLGPPTPSWIIDRPIPAAWWIIDRAIPIVVIREPHNPRRRRPHDRPLPLGVPIPHSDPE